MATSSSSEYYRSREVNERSLAEQATDAAIAHIHLDMANRYSRLLLGEPDVAAQPRDEEPRADDAAGPANRQPEP